LEWDAFVDNALIDVKVKDGIVTLSGTVGSAAEKDWANIDSYVQGAKSVDTTGLNVEKWARDKDLKGDKYQQKPPEEIVDALNDAFLYDPRVFSFEITPEVADDGATVILRGTVDNLKAKRAAALDARNTVGVRFVDNRIKVRPAVQISDEKIENDIRSALIRDPYVESDKITVDVANGMAYLFGTVNTNFEKSRADDIASKVRGVITVDNNLMVRDHNDLYAYNPYVDDWYIREYPYDRPRFPGKSDWQIKSDIESELFWSPFVDSDDVNVTVDDGVATLSGTVDSWAEYNAAANNAYEGGAVYVDNELTMK
jgi:osmotically-inducible protein OsmY